MATANKYRLYKNGKKVSDYEYTARELAGMFDVTDVTINKYKNKVFRNEYEFRAVTDSSEIKLTKQAKKWMEEWDAVTARAKRRIRERNG